MKLPKAERRARVERLVAHLGVKIDLNRYPYELSGGQQQLVSIMRALVVEPEILFLDEPFSALDYEMTLFMRDQLQRIFMETGTTTVLVSHDLEEAVYLADRVLLLSRGRRAIADFVRYDAPRPRTDATLSESGLRARSRRIASRSSSARCARDETRFDPFLPLVGVVGLIVALVPRGLVRRSSTRCCCRRRPTTFRALWKGMAGGQLGFDFCKTVERTIARDR